MACQHGQIVGADLVGSIAIGGNAVGTDDHGLYLTLLHKLAGGTVRDKRDRDAVVEQFPAGKAAALQPGPGFACINLLQITP